MTDFPDLKIKTLVNFPSNAIGGAGIDVGKVNGNFIVDLAYQDFAPPVSGVSDAAHQNALLWNNLTDQYVLAPITLIGSAGSVPEAPNDGALYGRKNLTWASAAPLASPTFTGIPAAPTAAPATNTTQIATTGFVTAAVSASGGVTPSALTRTNDTNITLTLGGVPNTALLQATSITAGWSGTLAAARGGFGADVSAQNGVPLFATGAATFTSTVGTGNFVRAVSPVFTGTPAAPTPIGTDVSTTLATTAYVGASWTAYTPTATVTGGAGTATGRYKQLGKTVFITAEISVTTGGSLASFTLPAGMTAAQTFHLLGRERAHTGAAWLGAVANGSSSATTVNYTNSATVTTGDVLAFSGVIEIS